MNYPKLRFVFDRKRVATKKNKGLVQIEVYSDRQRKFISTGVKVYSDQWNERYKVVNTPSAISLNEMLDAQMNGIQEWISGLIKKSESFDFIKLDRFLKNKSVDSAPFTEFVEKRIRERADIRESTKRSELKLVRSLNEFGKIIYFSDLTKANVLDYDTWLHSKGYKQQTIHSYHKYMKTYINDAIRSELMEKNPYEGIKIERGKSSIRKYLTDEEIQRIKDAKIASASICRVRDLFLFQCYTGFAYAELAKFDFSTVIQRNGKYIVHDARKKTGEDFYVVLLSPAVEILKKYDFVLPVISNEPYNLRLKVLAEYAGIDKTLTSHMGRHTFAVRCLNNGVKIENLAKMMGHTDIKTTQIYAKVLNEEVEREFEGLENVLTKK